MNALLSKTLIAAALAAVAGSANAAPTFAQGSVNQIYFNFLENQYRTAAGCAATPGECLAFNAANDPTGWQRVDPSIANTVKAGDVFAGIGRVQNIDPLWSSVPGDRFNAYVAQQVVSVTIGSAGPTNAVLTLGNPTVDPFGVLAANEQVRFYSGSYNFNAIQSDTTFAMISGVTSDTFWGSLGLDGTKNTYSYSLSDLTLPGTQAKVQNYDAWNLAALGPAYSAGKLELVNDPNETIVGGNINPQLRCSAADVANPFISCSDFVGTAEVEFNANSAVAGTGSSNWIYVANDPLVVYRTPEPGSIALLGLGLFGMAAGRRRRSS